LEPFRFAKTALLSYLKGMLREQLEIPPAAAKAFVRDVPAFFKEGSQLKRDEIAGRQLHALQAFQRPRENKCLPQA
jgi:hypothetical protein